MYVQIVLAAGLPISPYLAHNHNISLAPVLRWTPCADEEVFVHDFD